MTLESDAIVDRRRLRRKLTFWRVGAVVVAIAAIAATAYTAIPSSAWTKTGNGYIARIKITGLIRGNDQRSEALEKLSKSSAKASPRSGVRSPLKMMIAPWVWYTFLYQSLTSCRVIACRLAGVARWPSGVLP